MPPSEQLIHRANIHLTVGQVYVSAVDEGTDPQEGDQLSNVLRQTDQSQGPKPIAWRWRMPCGRILLTRGGLREKTVNRGTVRMRIFYLVP